MKAALVALLFVSLSAAFQVAGFWFLDAWISTGRTTSYAPFFWDHTYVGFGEVLNLTYGALIFSFAVAVVASFTLGWHLGREAR